MSLKIAVVYSHHKLGDLIWQLPYIKSISKNFNLPVTLITRPKTQAKDILKDNDYINEVFYFHCEIYSLFWIVIGNFFIQNIGIYLFMVYQIFPICF